MKEIRINRRAFLVIAGEVLGAGMAVPLSGCLFSLHPEPDAPPTEAVAGRVDDNHDHRAVFAKTRMESGKGIILDITGMSTHPHTISLSAEDVESILAGKHVFVRSTVDWGHDHGVHFNLG
jgi:hypothetical protein